MSQQHHENTTRNHTKIVRFDTMINYKQPQNQSSTSHFTPNNYYQVTNNNNHQQHRSSSITKQTANKIPPNDYKKSKYSSQQAFDDFDYDNCYKNNNKPNHQVNGPKGKANRKKPQLPEDAFYNPEKNMLYVKKGDNSENTMKTSINVILELDRTSSYSTNSSDEDITYHTPRFRAGSMVESNQITEFYDNSSPNVAPIQNTSKDTYRNRRRFIFFEVLFNGENKNVDGPKEKNTKSNCYYASSTRHHYPSSQIFGGFDMKKGPTCQLELPTFL